MVGDTRLAGAARRHSGALRRERWIGLVRVWVGSLRVGWVFVCCDVCLVQVGGVVSMESWE